MFSEKEILTGPELCQLLDIDYDKIKELRKVDQEKNFDYFVGSLLDIPDVKEKLVAILKNQEY